MQYADWLAQTMDLRSQDYEAMRTRLGPNSLDFLHGAIGAATEVVEFRLALDRHSLTNTVEELGDMAWFIALMAQSIGHTPYQPEKPFPHTARLEELANELLDVAKAYVFYGREPDAEVLRTLLDQFWQGIQTTAMGLGLTMEKLLAANTAKLKTRYPDRFNTTDCNIRTRLDAEVQAMEAQLQ